MAQSVFQILEKIEEMLAEIRKNREQLEEKLMLGISEEFKVLISSLDSPNFSPNEIISPNSNPNSTLSLNSSDLETKSDDESDFGGLEVEIPLTVTFDEEQRTEGNQNRQEEVLLILPSKSQRQLNFGECIQGSWESIIWNWDLFSNPSVYDTGQNNICIDVNCSFYYDLRQFEPGFCMLTDSGIGCFNVTFHRDLLVFELYSHEIVGTNWNLNIKKKVSIQVTRDGITHDVSTYLVIRDIVQLSTGDIVLIDGIFINTAKRMELPPNSSTQSIEFQGLQILNLNLEVKVLKGGEHIDHTSLIKVSYREWHLYFVALVRDVLEKLQEIGHSLKLQEIGHSYFGQKIMDGAIGIVARDGDLEVLNEFFDGSNNIKYGKGGLGAVNKKGLHYGRGIAVEKLLRIFGHGSEELKNVVDLLDIIAGTLELAININFSLAVHIIPLKALITEDDLQGVTLLEAALEIQFLDFQFIPKDLELMFSSLVQLLSLAKNNFRYCALEDMFDVLGDRGNKMAINFVILRFDKGFEKAAWELSLVVKGLQFDHGYISSYFVSNARDIVNILEAAIRTGYPSLMKEFEKAIWELGFDVP